MRIFLLTPRGEESERRANAPRIPRETSISPKQPELGFKKQPGISRGGRPVHPIIEYRSGRRRRIAGPPLSYRSWFRHPLVIFFGKPSGKGGCQAAFIVNIPCVTPASSSYTPSIQRPGFWRRGSLPPAPSGRLPPAESSPPPGIHPHRERSLQRSGRRRHTDV